jgi:D-glycero-D-manno-heptose 1,7-bisphosphate phosphatase
VSRSNATPRPGAVFLDRDGTVIEDRHYLGDPDGVVLLPTAAAAIRRLNRAGVPAILVTNQSGIGRGLFSEADCQAVQHRLDALLAAEGAALDGVFHCPHAPDGPACECRKPLPGLFLRAAREHGLDLARSAFVGDRLRDVVPAAEWGGTPILVGSPRHRDDDGEPPPGSHVVPTLEDAVLLALAVMAGD